MEAEALIMMAVEVVFHQEAIYRRSHAAEVPTYLLEQESNVPQDLHLYLASRMVSRGKQPRPLRWFTPTTVIISQPWSCLVTLGMGTQSQPSGEHQVPFPQKYSPKSLPSSGSSSPGEDANTPISWHFLLWAFDFICLVKFPANENRTGTNCQSSFASYTQQPVTFIGKRCFTFQGQKQKSYCSWHQVAALSG